MKSKELAEDTRMEKLLEAEQEYVGEIGYRFHNENDKHLHTFNGKPLLGTSTVTSVLAKPLTWWASGLACEKFGWINKGNAKKGWTPKEERLQSVANFRVGANHLSDEEWLALCDEAYSAHSKKLDSTATEGTDMHAELERFVNDKISGKAIDVSNYIPKIHPFILWSEQNVKRFIASEGHTYSTKLWVGGITDCILELNDGKIGIMDFKSSKESYDSQFMQIAGYELQINENGVYDDNGVQTWKADKPFDFYAVVPFGAEKFTVDMRYNTDELKDGFIAMVTLYKIINK